MAHLTAGSVSSAEGCAATRTAQGVLLAKQKAAGLAVERAVSAAFRTTHLALLLVGVADQFPAARAGRKTVCTVGQTIGGIDCRKGRTNQAPTIGAGDNTICAKPLATDAAQGQMAAILLTVWTTYGALATDKLAGDAIRS